jgi:hypothetical protein
VKYINEEDKNTFITQLGYSVVILSNLILLPIILIKFNDIDISIWLLLGTLTAFSSLIDFGFSPTLIRFVSYYWTGKNIVNGKSNTNNSDPDLFGLTKFMSTVNVVYLIIGIALFILLLFGSSILFWKILDGNTNINYYILTILIFNLRLVFYLFTVKYLAILQGVKLIFKAKKTELINSLMKYTIMLILIFLGFKLLVLVIVDFILTILLFLILKKKCESLISINLFKNFKFNLKIFHEFWRPTYQWGLMQVGSFFTNYSSNFIVSNVGSPKEISLYLIIVKILNFIKLLTTSPINSNLPIIFGVIADENIIKLKLLFFKQIQKALIINLILSFGFLTCGLYFLNIFGLNTDLISFDFIVIGVLMIFLESHHSMNAQVYMGSNKIPFVLPSILTGLVVITITMFLLLYFKLSIFYIFYVQFIVQLSFNNWYCVFKNLQLLNISFKHYVVLLFNLKKIYK